MRAVQRTVRPTVRRAARQGPWPGLAGQVVVLAALDATVGLGRAGWLLGGACGLTTTLLLSVGLARRGPAGPGPADWVTLLRATLVGGVVALTADSAAGPAASPGAVRTLVAVAAVALALDWVDGQVARRTGTASALGARFDMEVDALLILVLCCHVAPATGPWVLLIGAARYLRLLSAGPWPWLRRQAPTRYWAKVVAAVQGVGLTVVAAGVLPAVLATGVLLVALSLLVESFGREAWWLWRHRDPAAAPAARLSEA